MIAARPASRALPTRPLAARLSALLGGLLLSACSGGGGGQTEQPRGAAIPEAMLAQTWQVRLSDATARGPFESHPGWGAFFQRNYDQALTAFGADPGDGEALSRAHLEHAELYRQAAKLAASALVEVYGETLQPEDPVEVAYLLGASYALLGDLAHAREALAKLPPKSAVAAQAACWQAWLDKGGVWPPDADLTGFPGQPGAVALGTAPTAGDLPHYHFAEQGEGGHEVRISDPTTLYLLSRWHEAAARQAAPKDDAVLSELIGVWRLPAEPAPASDLLPISDAWLFLSPMMTAEDAAFLAAASKDGVPAVAAWSARSPLAAAVAPAIEGGAVVPDKMLDQAAWLGNQLEAAMKARSGSAEAFHRGFADMGRVGALRAAMIVADAAGQTRDAGILRVNALDRSVDSAADPVFFMSIAAWDTGNRNAQRAQDLVHGLSSRFPAVEAARLPLDALGIRLGRNAAPAPVVF